MINKHDYPILERDTSPVAKLNPKDLRMHSFDTNKLVITFFPEVIEKLKAEGQIELERVIPGENIVEIYRFTDSPDILLVQGMVGCPACGGNLDMFNGMGINKVMFCGGGGVLDGSIGVGTLLVVEGAIRDEGFSYHYLPPSRVAAANDRVNGVVTKYMEANGIPYIKGLVWTTDAIFRETEDKIALRRSEGAKIVEMEQAGCLAVAAFRGFDYGSIIYGGDDLSQSEWSDRSWRSRNGMRYDLVQLCKTLVKQI